MCRCTDDGRQHVCTRDRDQGVSGGVFPYLIWRRQWAAAASTLVVVPRLFLFVVPGPIRGFEANVAGVKTWYRGHGGSEFGKGSCQRDEQNWSWSISPIIAMTHRLTRGG